MKTPVFPGARSSTSPAPRSTSRWYAGRVREPEEERDGPADRREVLGRERDHGAARVRDRATGGRERRRLSHGALARAGRRTRRRAGDLGLAAAVLGEVVDETAHRGEVRGVDQRAALAPAGHEPGALELREVERERRPGQLEPLRDPPRRHAPRARARPAPGRSGAASPAPAPRAPPTATDTSMSLEISKRARRRQARRSAIDSRAVKCSRLGTRGCAAARRRAGARAARRRRPRQHAKARCRGERSLGRRLPAHRAGRAAAHAAAAAGHALSAADELRRAHRGQRGGRRRRRRRASRSSGRSRSTTAQLPVPAPDDEIASSLVLEALKRRAVVRPPGKQNVLEIGDDRLRVSNNDKVGTDLRGAQPKQDLTPRSLLGKSFAMLVTTGPRQSEGLHAARRAERQEAPGLDRTCASRSPTCRSAIPTIPSPPARPGTRSASSRTRSDGSGLAVDVECRLVGFEKIDDAPCAHVSLRASLDEQGREERVGLQVRRGALLASPATRGSTCATAQVVDGAARGRRGRRPPPHRRRDGSRRTCACATRAAPCCSGWTRCRPRPPGPTAPSASAP